MQETVKRLIRQAISPGSDRVSAEKELMDYQNMQPIPYITTLCELFKDHEADVSFTAGILMRNAVLYAFNEQSWEMLNISKLMKETCYRVMNENRNGRVAASLLAGIYRHEIVSGKFNDFFIVLGKMIETGGFLGQNAVICLTQATNNMKEIMDLNAVGDLMMNAFCMVKPFIVTVLVCLNDVQVSLKKVIKQNPQKWIQVLLGFCRQENEIACQAIINITTFITYGADTIPEQLGQLNDFMIGFTQSGEEVSIMAIEYFSVLSELEKSEKKVYMGNAMHKLIPSLFIKLKKDKDFDENAWSSHKAASACLQAISSDVDILADPSMRNYIGMKLLNESFLEKEEGIIALGSCINQVYLSDDVDHSMPVDEAKFVFIRNMAQILISNLDKNETREASLFTLAKLCEANLFCIETDNLIALIGSIQAFLEFDTIESSNAIWIISSIAEFATQSGNPYKINKLLCIIYPKLIQPLIDIFDCNFDNLEPQVQVAIFTTLQSVIKICPHSYIKFLNESLWIFFLTKLDNCFNESLKRSRNEIYLIEDTLCGYLCIIFEMHLKIQSKDGETTLRKVFVGFLTASFSALTLEEVYRCLSALCSNKSLLITHINEFIPFILRDLNLSDRGVLISLITLIGDVSTSLQVGFLPYADQMVPVLINLIGRPDVALDVKPQVILLFSDIVLSLGHSSKQYFEVFFTVIEQASAVDRDFDVKFVDSLRNASLVLLESFFYSFNESDLLLYKRTEIINILQKICNEDKSGTCVRESLRLCGEIVMKYNLDESHWTRCYINSYLNDGEYRSVACEVHDMICEPNTYRY